MRKKIFIIHGKGERDGIGKNGGGDLDTISSNVFYGAWAEHTIPQEKGAAAVYGEDYEFDFINYQQGLSHLVSHRGCDLYIPDFPIDALPPRLRLMQVGNPYEFQVRKMLAGFLAELYPTAYAYRHALDDNWKELVNDLFSKATNILDKRSFFEIEMAAFGIYFTTTAIIALGTLDQNSKAEIEEYFLCSHLENLRNGLGNILQNTFKRDVLNAVPQANTRVKLAVADSIRADFGIIFRNKNSNQPTVSLVEGVAVIANTGKLLAEVGAELSPAEQEGLQQIAAGARTLVRNNITALQELMGKLCQAAGREGPIAERLAAAYNWTAEVFTFLDSIETYLAYETETGPVKSLRVMLVEEANGQPVPGIDVHFRVRTGDGELALPGKPGAAAVAVTTDELGSATVELRLPEGGSPYEVFATFDDMVFLPFRDKDAPYRDGSAPAVKSVSSGLNPDKAEAGQAVDPDLALRMSCSLIERDIRYLAANDVRIVRFDDHHPYTPVILETLQRLRDEGLIETIQLSSLPRGQEQPKEQQKCGADLIYETFVKGTPADNDGLALLQELAHVQDLHIREEELAIDLSKLLGSKVNKIAMVKGLMGVKTIAALADIMTTQGWDQRVEQYEEGLLKIMHRVDNTLSCIHLLLPPADDDFGKHLGWKSVLKPFVGLGKKAELKEAEIKKLYAENPVNSVKIFTAISPFCNPKIGEPQINVASCINYLRDDYDFDYFFYNYGSFLMTTRRVNANSFKIDLNEVVSFIGSKADGGHAEAASGKPASNPDFPAHRFSNISDKNYQEFLFYIAGKLHELTGLLVYKVTPVPIKFLPEKLRPALQRLLRNLLLVTIGKGRDAVRVLIALHGYPNRDEPELTFPVARNFLLSKLQCNYLFYCYSANNLVMINHDDPEERLDLAAFAKVLGTYRDGGYRVAAACEPKYCPTFPYQHFKFVNPRSFLSYAGYLVDTLRREFPQIPITATVPPAQLDSDIAKVGARMPKNMMTIDFACSDRSKKRPGFQIVAALAPFSDKKLGEPQLTAGTAAIYLQSIGRTFRFFLYCESGYRFSLLALTDTPWLDLAAIAEKIEGKDKMVYGPSLSMSPKVPGTIGKVNFRTFKPYLEWLTGEVGAAVGYDVQVVTPLEAN